MTKKSLKSELKTHTDGASVITKTQLARFFGFKKPTTRIDDIVSDLTAIDGKYYLISDIAEVLERRSA